MSESDASVESFGGEVEERVIEYDVGTRYVGQVKNNKRSGKGLFYYKDNSYYDGNWKDNRMHGRGSLFDSNGMLLYDGGWYMDNFHGKGRIFNDQPVPLSDPFDHKSLTADAIDLYWSAYEGDFAFGEKHGKGKLKLSNGEVFIGSFMEDNVEGEGKFYHQDGSVVAGKWSKGFLMSQTS